MILEQYGKIKAEKEALEFAMDYMSWYQTAKVGYIYAKTTPRNTGKLYLRCSDPRGRCYGQIPFEVANSRLECGCGWPFYICQRFLPPSPPEGSEMEIKLINLRIKRAYGTNKCARQIYDDDGQPIEGNVEWGNANPTHRSEYGDPPEPNPVEEGYKKKYWPERKTELSKGITADMLSIALDTKYYSGLQQIPYVPWHIGHTEHVYPYQWIHGEKKPYFRDEL